MWRKIIIIIIPLSYFLWKKKTKFEGWIIYITNGLCFSVDSLSIIKYLLSYGVAWTTIFIKKNS